MSTPNEIAAFLLLHGVFEDTDENIPVFKEWGEKLSLAIPDLIERLHALQMPMADVDIQTVFYDVGKQYLGEGKPELRKWFEVLYCIFLNSHTGSRWGMMFNIIGKEDFIFRLEYHFENLMMLSVRKN